MTPEPIKALAELRALSEAATPGPWRRLITARTAQVTAGDRPVAKFARLADAAFIPALVNAFRADPAALLSLVPAEVLPDDTVCACLDETGERKVRLYERCQRCGAFMEADYLAAILNQDTGSAEPEPLRFDLVDLLGNIAATQGRLVPPTGPYVLMRDIYAAFGAEAAYDAIAGASAEPGEGPVDG